MKPRQKRCKGFLLLVALMSLCASHCDDAAPSGRNDVSVGLPDADRDLPVDDGEADADQAADTGVSDVSRLDTAVDSDGAELDTDAVPYVPGRLEVRFLGVQGFSLRLDPDHILTAPLYTNPNMLAVTLGEIASDHGVVDRFLDADDVSDVRAILVGHAHYDHLLDVPYVWTMTDDAAIFGNLSTRRILDGFAPVPSPPCAPLPTPTPWALVPRERVVALDDPGSFRVDTRQCAGAQVCGAPWPISDGAWVPVPRTRVRIRALCSHHPDQFAIVHFGEGCVESSFCTPPASAGAWLEGATLAYLVDFLDPSETRPVFRVYFQDAPTNGPLGHVHPDLLAEKRVDLALLTVGNYDQVRDQPGEILAAMNPRYAIGGHWEDFFKTQDEPITPIPLQPSIDVFAQRLETALPPGTEAAVLVDGVSDVHRGWVPMPGTDFAFDAEPAP